MQWGGHSNPGVPLCMEQLTRVHIIEKEAKCPEKPYIILQNSVNAPPTRLNSQLQEVKAQ